MSQEKAIDRLLFANSFIKERTFALQAGCFAVPIVGQRRIPILLDLWHLLDTQIRAHENSTQNKN